MERDCNLIVNWLLRAINRGEIVDPKKFERENGRLLSRFKKWYELSCKSGYRIYCRTTPFRLMRQYTKDITFEREQMRKGQGGEKKETTIEEKKEEKTK